VQIKKELTIAGMDVDKLSIYETFRLFYNCIFTPDERALEILRKILLIKYLPTGGTCRHFLLTEAHERIKL